MQALGTVGHLNSCMLSADDEFGGTGVAPAGRDLCGLFFNLKRFFWKFFFLFFWQTDIL